MLLLRLLARLALIGLTYLFLYRASALAGLPVVGRSHFPGDSGTRGHPEGAGHEPRDPGAGSIELEASPGALGPGSRFALGARTVLGRAGDCDIVIDDPYVSASHAEIVRIGARYAVRDLGSANGTYVNGTEVRRQRVLRPGDRVTLGDTILRFRG